jgi:hypothetical protein
MPARRLDRRVADVRTEIRATMLPSAAQLQAMTAREADGIDKASAARVRRKKPGACASRAERTRGDRAPGRIARLRRTGEGTSIAR